MARDAGNVFLSLNGVDVSSKVRSIGGIDQSREEVDITNMGATIRTMQATIEQSIELQVVFNIDDYTGTLFTTLNTMWSNPGTAYAVIVRTDAGVIGAANPEFRFNARLIQRPLFDNAQPGQTLASTCVFRRVTAVTVATS